MFPLNLYARVRFLLYLCTRDRGCSAHPVFPASLLGSHCALYFLGRTNLQNSGASCREKVEACEIRTGQFNRARSNPNAPEMADCVAGAALLRRCGPEPGRGHATLVLIGAVMPLSRFRAVSSVLKPACQSAPDAVGFVPPEERSPQSGECPTKEMPE